MNDARILLESIRNAEEGTPLEDIQAAADYALKKLAHVWLG